MIDIIVNLHFKYSGHEIIFKKIFEMPSAPFIGLGIYDSKDGYDSLIEIINNDYKRSLIYYDINAKCYYVDIHNRYPQTVSHDTINQDLKTYDRLNWDKIKDDSDIIKKIAKERWKQ